MRDSPLEVTPVPDGEQLAVLYDGRADMSFVRLPVESEGLNIIPLYTETPVVVVPVDHPVAAYDEIPVGDLADEHLLQDPAMSLKEAIDTVASGVGIVIVPQSLARLHHRKDVTYRPVTGVAESQVGLAWLSDAADPRIETFIGIVRGRTARSSRAGEATAPEVSAKKVAKPPRARVKPRSASARKPGGGGRRRRAR